MIDAPAPAPAQVDVQVFWLSLDTIKVAPAQQDYAGNSPGVQVTPLWGRPLQPVIKRTRPRLTREKDLVLLGII